MKINPNRVIYSFEIERSVKEFVNKEITAEDGTIKKIKEEETVKKPVNLFILKPSRYLEEEAQLFHAEKFNHFINRGLLTSQMMLKKIGDNGGVFSKSDLEDYERIMRESLDSNYAISNYLTLPDSEKEDPVEKEKFENAKAILQDATNKIFNYKRSFEAAFSQSADSMAEKKLLDWYFVHLCYYSSGDKEEAEPLFKGDTFEDKLDDYFAKDDDSYEPDSEVEKLEKEIFKLASDKLINVLSIWYYNYGRNKEQIEEILDSLKKTDGEET